MVWGGAIAVAAPEMAIDEYTSQGSFLPPPPASVAATLAVKDSPW